MRRVDRARRRGIEEDAARPDSGTLLFEVAWEVCNQVGGIYQVLRSKAATLGERWRNRYCLVGPWIETKAVLDYEPVKPGGWIGRVLDTLAQGGTRCHYGRWLVPGNPRVILIEPGLDAGRLGQVKYRLWKDHGIESPGHDGLIDGAIGFGEGVRRLLEQVSHDWGERRGNGRRRRVLTHFHEWLGSFALPMVRHQGLPVGTVFTTHATILGRYVASSEEGFYDRLSRMNDAHEATRYNVRTQHVAERVCAQSAHVLTTVSSITGEECTHLLGRTPDVVTPNGLNIDRLHAAHEMQRFHAQYKGRINDFVMGHFFPTYSFDLDKTLYIFTSGRFEPRNKGFDVCLEAMARLNGMLRAGQSETTVVFFVITQRATHSINPVALQGRGVLNELREVCDTITREVGEPLYRRAASGERLGLDDLVDDYWALRYRRTQHAFKTQRLPLVVTHLMDHDQQDPVLNQIRHLQLFNRPEDRVKVVYHPEFITPVNPLWGIEYEQFVRGCHMGVFPSAYEPWGYTPLECAAMGVPSVSSDLAGFGRYVTETFLGHEELGIGVLRRRGRSFDEAANDLAMRVFEYTRLRRRDRIALRNAVERSSWEFDWRKLIAAYHRAHDLALERAFAETAPADGGSTPG